METMAEDSTTLQKQPNGSHRDTKQDERNVNKVSSSKDDDKEEGEVEDDEGAGTVEEEKHEQGTNEHVREDNDEDEDRLSDKLALIRSRRVQAAKTVQKNKRALEKSGRYSSGNALERDEESEGKKASGLASAIVGHKRDRQDDHEEEPTTERPSEKIQDPTLKKRNKKMFGVLMGHLNSARSSLNSSKEKQIQQQREKRWKEVEAKEEEQCAKLRESFEREHREEMEKAQAQRDKLLANELELEAKLLKHKLAKHHNTVFYGQWIRTRMEPRLFWAPNSSDKDFIERGIPRAHKEAKKEIETHETDLESIMKQAEDKAQEIRSKSARNVTSKEDDNAAGQGTVKE